MSAPTQSIELVFPFRGMDVTREWGLQPDNTTVLSINTRSFDPETGRSRGAARCGITKYINQKLGLFSLIQHLNVIVDPTVEATLSEWETDYWFRRRRGRRARREKRYIRRRGSGIRHRKRKETPEAVDDTTTAVVNGATVTTYILENDTYAGTPTVEIGPVAHLRGGTVSLSGPVGGWAIVYTPGTTGQGGSVVVPYKLTATGNKGRDYAKLTITVSPASSIGPGDYPVTVSGVEIGDGSYTLTIDPGNGLNATTIIFFSDGFDPLIIQAAAEEAAGNGSVFVVTNNLTPPGVGPATITITGDYGAGPGYEGSAA